MSVTLDLPPDLARGIEAEAARRGQRAEDTLLDLLRESLKQLPAGQEPATRAARLSAILDRWDAEDAANPSDAPVPDPLRVSFRVPNVG